VKIGIGMGYSDDELKRLSLAALMHDVGMGDIPEAIWTKKRLLSPSESKELRKHPLYGYERLKSLDEIATIVLQEHERMDGSGYPHGLAGDAINEFSYLIGAADIYDSLLHTRPYRDTRYSPFEAIKEIVTKEKQRFPASVLKSLVALTSSPAVSTRFLSTSLLPKLTRLNPRRGTTSNMRRTFLTEDKVHISWMHRAVNPLQTDKYLIDKILKLYENQIAGKEKNMTPSTGIDAHDKLMALLNKNGLTEKKLIRGVTALEKTHKNVLYSNLLSILSNLQFNEKSARKHWESIIAHKKEISSSLGRKIDIRVALLDYFLAKSKK
jgi:hypothetical protein